MNHLDLFSGIGGFSLAAQWAGIETVAFCEIDPFCQKVLVKNFPSIPIFEDIKELKRSDIKYEIDIITGGFPCQPFSVAGNKKGTKDDRDLWPQMFRVIQEFKPTWVIGENVANFVNMAFQRTKTDLESEGYEVQPFIIPACGVNAPHRRDRVWIVGYTDNPRNRTPEYDADKNRAEIKQEQEDKSQLEFSGSDQTMVYTNDKGFQRFQQSNPDTVQSGQKSRFPFSGFTYDYKLGLPNIPKNLRVDDGVSNRVDRIKGLGNAIVPQVAYQIFKGVIHATK